MRSGILSLLLAIFTLLSAIPAIPVTPAYAADASPVIYIKMNGGSDSNSGTSASAPVQTIVAAFDKLAAIGKGGTVVLMDGVNTRTSSSGKLTTLADAGGHVTVTGCYNGVNYKEQNDARLILINGLIFQNDVTFDYLTFLQIAATNTRTLYLNHNDLTVTENCDTYDYVTGESYAIGVCPPIDKDSPIAKGNGNLVIVTGYKDTSASTTPESFGDQVITLNGAQFGAIHVGNKYYTTSAITEQTRADTGTTWIKIGNGVGVKKGITATQEHTKITTNVRLPDTSVSVILNKDLNVSDYVTVQNPEYFASKGSSLKDYEADGIRGPAVGISYDIDVPWVDSAPVSEFGVAFRLADSIPFSTLNGAKRSYAYTDASDGYRNYRYEFGSSTASFKGVLVYDEQNEISEYDTDITAYPYAIDKTTGYAVVGENYKLNLKELCYLISKNENAPESDKVLADDIIFRAENFVIERFATDPVPKATESTVVYVSQAGGGNGLTPSSTVTFEEALGMTKNVVANTVVIVVTDAITLDPADTIDQNRNDTGAVSADFTYYFPANKSKVIITSNYGGVNYRKDHGASITLTSETAFYGDYTIKNTELINATDLKLCMQYNNVTLGTGLTCTMGANATKYIDLVCGYHAEHSAFNTAETVSCREDARIEILGGKWNGFTAGNVTQNWRSVFGNICKGATLVVDIGNASTSASFNSTDRYYFAVAGQNNVDGTVCVNVNNATFVSSNAITVVQYLMKYDPMMSDYHPVINGNVILNIKGGSFKTNKVVAVPSADSANYAPNVGSNAKINVNVMGGTFYSGALSTTKLQITGSGTATSELYLASGFTASSTSGITTVQAPTADPVLDYAKTTYDAPPVYDKVIVEGLFDLSSASSSELADLQASLPPSDTASSHLTTVKKYYTNANKDLTLRADMMVLNDDNYNLTKVANVEFITMLSGEYSINKTFTNYNIGASGGGYMVDCGDFVLMAFGDTEGEASNSADKNDPAYGGPWRANVLGFTDDFDYKDGVLLDGFYLSDQGVYDGFATEFLNSGHKSGVEMSKIPTGGVKIGNNLYFCYMSVRRWSSDTINDPEDVEGIWKCNYGGLAVSRDMGRTWETPSDLRWDEITDFAQLYPVLDNEGKWLYLYGVPGGRRGAVKLMRVAVGEVENVAAYEYFTGFDNRGKAIFEQGASGLANSKPVIDTPAGDDGAGAGGLAIMYNEYLGEWVMLYASKRTGEHNLAGIYIRVANSIDGKWSDPVLVISQSAGFGAVYEPRVCAKYQNAETGEMMLITSNWGVYNSMVYNITLERRGKPYIDIIQ